MLSHVIFAVKELNRQEGNVHIHDEQKGELTVTKHELLSKYFIRRTILHTTGVTEHGWIWSGTPVIFSAYLGYRHANSS